MLRAAALLGVEFALPDLTTVLGQSVADLVPALDEARASGGVIDLDLDGSPFPVLHGVRDEVRGDRLDSTTIPGSDDALAADGYL